MSTDSRHLALALREAGYHVDFHCSFEFHPTSAGARALRFIARSDDTSLGSLLERRKRPAFYSLKPRNWYLPDLLVAVARRLDASKYRKPLIVSRKAGKNNPIKAAAQPQPAGVEP